MDTMKFSDAMQVLSQVCANYKGTLQEHQAIQNALRTISMAEPKQEKVVEEAEVVDGSTDDGPNV